MEISKDINTENLYSDTIRRIKILFGELKNYKLVIYEYYRRLLIDISKSTSGIARKELLELIESSKGGTLDLKNEIINYVKKNKKKLNKYSFESTFRMVKKIENTKLEITKKLFPSIEKIKIRIGNMEGHDQKKYKSLLNKFYYISNNYVKIVFKSKKSEEIMEWLLERVK